MNNKITMTLSSLTHERDGQEIFSLHCPCGNVVYLTEDLLEEEILWICPVCAGLVDNPDKEILAFEVFDNEIMNFCDE